MRPKNLPACGRSYVSQQSRMFLTGSCQCGGLMASPCQRLRVQTNQSASEVHATSCQHLPPAGPASSGEKNLHTDKRPQRHSFTQETAGVKNNTSPLVIVSRKRTISRHWLTACCHLIQLCCGVSLEAHTQTAPSVSTRSPTTSW